MLGYQPLESRVGAKAQAGTTIDAKFRGMTGKVKLKNTDGSIITVPLDQLSDADHAWIKAKR